MRCGSLLLESLQTPSCFGAEKRGVYLFFQNRDFIAQRQVTDHLKGILTFVKRHPFIILKLPQFLKIKKQAVDIRREKICLQRA